MTYELIIDGYNLMHFAGLARSSYGPGDLERCRTRLLRKLRRELTREERKQTTVVFDGTHQEVSEHRQFHRFEMTVIFSPFRAEADDVIEELIRRHSVPKQLLVISSDNRLQKAARVREAGHLDSDTFLYEIEQRANTANESDVEEVEQPSSKEPQLDSAEVDEWLTEFEDIDVQAIQESVEREAKKKRAIRKDAPKPTAQPDQSSVERDSQPLQEQVDADDSDELSESGESELTLSETELDFWIKRVAELSEGERKSVGKKREP